MAGSPASAACRSSSDADVFIKQMQQRFEAVSQRLIGRIDEFSTKLDELEKNIYNSLQHSTREVQFTQSADGATTTGVAGSNSSSKSPARMLGRSITTFKGSSRLASRAAEP